MSSLSALPGFGGDLQIQVLPVVAPDSYDETSPWWFNWTTASSSMLGGNVSWTAFVPEVYFQSVPVGVQNELRVTLIGRATYAWGLALVTSWVLSPYVTEGGYNKYNLTPYYNVGSYFSVSGVRRYTLNVVPAASTHLLWIATAETHTELRFVASGDLGGLQGNGGAANIESDMKAANPSSWGSIRLIAAWDKP